ncbi:CNNM domain-containing protein [bacterium]|nr:CNNM domain-containing protein [bacterium]
MTVAESLPATELDVALLIAYVLLALVVSFLCSIAEAVLLSVTPLYIEGLKEKHPRRARLLRRLKLEKVDQSLAAILTLNTIAHTVGALGAGAKATIVFGSAWFGMFSALMTLMILFLSEIIPKTIGAVYWSKLTGPTSMFVYSLVLLLYPIVWISEKVTKLISRKHKTHIFSRNEFLAMARIGEQTGDIKGNESRIIRNLFRFGSLTVENIMTPRTVITAFRESMSVLEAAQKFTEIPFSRVILYGDDIDDITGFVLKNDVLIFRTDPDTKTTLSRLKRDILIVPEINSLYTLMELFLEKRQHIALVIDEHGGTQGLVTLEDLVETLMGMEIMDETDTVKDMRALARKQWERRKKHLDIDVESFVPHSAQKKAKRSEQS